MADLFSMALLLSTRVSRESLAKNIKNYAGVNVWFCDGVIKDQTIAAFVEPLCRGCADILFI
jgi:prepilin-type processing-associated H-X9-DG protein